MSRQLPVAANRKPKSNSMRKLYLDIDGVILTKKHTRKANNLEEFIDFILKNFECYWLTTHCNGDNKATLKYLSQYLEVDLINKLGAIKSTSWSTLKTEAIDMTDDFIWIDDEPMQAEIEKLIEAGKLEKLSIAKLDNANELIRIIDAYS